MLCLRKTSPTDCTELTERQGAETVAAVSLPTQQAKTSSTERAELTERQGAELLTEPTLAAAEAGDLRYYPYLRFQTKTALKLTLQNHNKPNEKQFFDVFEHIIFDIYQ